MQGNGRNSRMNITERAARWSATHRKRAIWGWLGFVFALLVLIMGAQVVEQKDISTVDTFSGESQQAERALTDAGLRPTEEVALIQSKDLTATDPEFQQLVGQTTADLKATEHVANVKSPVDGGGAVSEDGHSVLVDFEITGPDVDAGVNVVESEDTIAALQKENPRVQRGAVRRGFDREEPQRDVPVRPRQGGHAVAAPDPGDPGHRPRRPGGGRRAAAAGADGRAGDDGACRHPEPGVPARQQRRAADPADRPRRRRRLLAVLHAPRARGTGERQEPAGVTAGRGSHLRPRGDDLRDHGDDRHVRDVHHRRGDVRVVRRRDRQRRSRRDVRLAARAAGRAGLARRSRRQGPDPVHQAAAPPGGRVAVLERRRQPRHAPAGRLRPRCPRAC